MVADGIDVVHVCVPNNLHLPLTLAALGAGKHVVCEKPLALDAGRGRGARRGRRGRGRVATVPFVYRYYPTVREARARVRRARSAGPADHGGYLQDWLLDAAADNWRVDPEPAAAPGRSPTSARTGATWSSSSPGSGSSRSRRAAPRSERIPARDDEDVATLLFETDCGAGRQVTRRSRAGRKNQLWSVAPRRRRVRPGAARDALDRQPRGAASCSRAASQLSPGRRQLLRSGRSPAGLPGLLRRLRRRDLRGDRRPAAPTGCRRSPTGCERRASPRPCSSRRGRRGWVNVASGA